jgi:enoyl-CoA hydratase
MTGTFTTVTFEPIGHVRRITLNRPDQHNPLTPRCVREILGAVAQAETDPDARVIVIRSTGRSFSSGYGFIAEDTDPGDFAPHAAIEGDVSAMLELAAGWTRLWDCAIPVIAQVQGNCLAGGTDLALHCDLVVAAHDARIGFPPVRSMGVPPTNMWLYHLGPQWTKRLLFTGDTISGDQARELGLVVATAAADELDATVSDLADRIALIGRDLLVANKRVVNMGVDLMGRAQLQRFAALHDAIGHRAPEAIAFSERIGQIGLREAVRERDARFD